MGSGIAQAAAVAGFATVVRDVSEPALRRGEAAVRSSLDRLVAKEKLGTAARETALTRLSWTSELATLADCGLVIEAIRSPARRVAAASRSKSTAPISSAAGRSLSAAWSRGQS